MPTTSLHLPVPSAPRWMGPLTTAVIRDGSDRWRVLLCSRGAPFPQATRLEAYAIAETEVFIHYSTQRKWTPIPMQKLLVLCLPARSLRSTAPSPACLLDPCPVLNSARQS